MTSPLTPVLRYLRHLTGIGTSSPETDADLLRRFTRQQDEEAFTALVLRHGPMVLRLGQRILGDEHSAEDVFQATFLVLARKAAGLRHPGTLSAWLHGVAYRLALKARAARARRLAVQRQVSLQVASVSGDPLVQMSARELLQVVHEELQRLPERYRLPIVLCCVQGRSQPEAARLLGWTEGSVKGRLERGRARLQARLVRRGLSVAGAMLVLELLRGPAGAALPGDLLRSTVALAVACARGLPVEGPSAAVAALAEGAGGGAAGKVNALLALVLAGAVLVAGTAAWPRHREAQQKPAEQLRSAEKSRPDASAESKKAIPPAAQEMSVGRDLLGDSLPPGAIARMGTLRLFSGDMLAYTPDGKTLVAYSYGKYFRLWDAHTGAMRHEFRPFPVDRQPWSIWTRAVSPTGKLLAEAGEGRGERGVRIWKLEGRPEKPWRRLPVREEAVTAVTFSPDGKLLAASAKGNILYLWNANDGREIHRIQGPRMNSLGSTVIPGALAFFPDGKTLVSASSDGNVDLWDVASGEYSRTLATQMRISSLALSPDGKRLAVVEVQSTLHILEAATGKEVLRTSQQNSFCGIAFSPDSKTLATTGRDDEWAHFWDAATGKELRRWKVGPGSECLAFAPDGKVIAQSRRGLDSIHLRDVETGREAVTLPGPRAEVIGVCFTDDGKKLITAGYDLSTALWDAETGKRLGPVHHFPRLQPKHLAPYTWIIEDGKKLVIPDYQGNFHLWRADTGEKLPPISIRSGAHGNFAFSKDCRILALTYSSGVLELWDTRKSRWLHRISLPDRRPYSRVAVSADGKVVVVSSGDMQPHLWDVESGRELPPPEQQMRDGCTALAVSADHRVAACPILFPPGVCRLCVWEVATGKTLQLIDGPWRPDRLVFSPDGRMVAAGGIDHVRNEVTVGEVASGGGRWELKGHGDSVVALTFSPDCSRLASGSFDRTAIVWDLTGLGKEPAHGPLSAAEQEALWADLAGKDAPRAQRAIWKLVGDGKRTVSLLQSRLQPVRSDKAVEIARLIEQLDSEDFTRREEATHALRQLGDVARPALVESLGEKPSAEARRRLHQLLRKMNPVSPSPDQLRELRALEVLEHIGSREARGLLEKLAAGAPAAGSSWEAKASLKRLQSRASR